MTTGAPVPDGMPFVAIKFHAASADDCSPIQVGPPASKIDIGSYWHKNPRG